MARYTRTPVSTLQGINNELAKVELAMQDTLDRKGVTPNFMDANLDMNSRRILNLPAPLTDQEPLRKGDLPTGVSVSSQYVDDKFLPTPTFLKSQGLSGNYGFFDKGFTYNEAGDVGIDSDGNIWTYNGTLPFNVEKGTVPSVPAYTQYLISKNYTRSFDSIDAVKAYSKLSKLIGQRITTGEYHAGTGYGGATYEVVSAGSVTPNDIDIIQGVADSGAAIELASNTSIAECYGIKHDETYNSTDSYNRAIENVSESGGGVLTFENPGVVVTDGVIPKPYVILRGLGRFVSFLVASSICYDVVLHTDDPTNPDLRGFGIEDMGIDGLNQQDGGRGLSIVSNNNLGSFKRLYIINTKQQGLLLDGQRFSSGIDFATYPRTNIKGGKWNYIDDLIILNCGLASSGDRDNIHIKDSTGPFIDNIQSAMNSNGAALYLENAAEFNCDRFECWETINAVKVKVTAAGRESGLCYIKDLKADYIEQDGLVLDAGVGSIERFNVDKFRAGSIGDTADNTYSVVKLIGASSGGGFVEDCVIKGVQNQRNVDTTFSPKYIFECNGSTRQNYFEVERAEDYGTNIANSMNDDSEYNTRNEIVVNNDLTQSGVAEFFRSAPISTGQTEVTIRHPLKVIPRRVFIQPRNNVAANAGNTYWSATDVDITISITGSVPSGSNAEFDVYMFRGEPTDKEGLFGDSK